MDNIYGEEFIPRRSTKESAGYDLYAVEDMNIQPWSKTYDTGVCLEDCDQVLVKSKADHWSFRDLWCDSWVALIVPRSSMGFKHGLRFANTICVVDRDYRDTIKVSLCAEHGFTIKKGERYAQMIIVPYGVLYDEIKPTNERGGGIGSTGQ